MPSREQGQDGVPPTDTGPHRRLRRGEDTQQRILAAAFSQIALHGISGLRTREIAAMAEVNISTLHYYYQTKDNLMAAVLDFIGDRFYRDFQVLPGRGAERIRAHFRQTIQYLASEPELHRVWLNFLVESFHSPPVQSVFQRLLERWHSCYESALLESWQDGQQLVLPPEQLTPVLMSITEGAVVQLLASPGTFDPERYFRDAEAALLPVG